MKYYTNDCCDCGLPCRFEACPYYRTLHIECDFCHEEVKLYHYNGYELCEDCILKEFDVVEGSY